MPVYHVHFNGKCFHAYSFEEGKPKKAAKTIRLGGNIFMLTKENKLYSTTVANRKNLSIPADDSRAIPILTALAKFGVLDVAEVKNWRRSESSGSSGLTDTSPLWKS